MSTETEDTSLENAYAVLLAKGDATLFEPWAKRLASMPIRFKELDQYVIRLFAHVTSRHVKEMKALRERVAALESKPQLHDAGVWKAGVRYEAGAVVSHQGSAWVNAVAHDAVGSDLDHTCFRLLVKRGRDAKDFR